MKSPTEIRSQSVVAMVAVLLALMAAGIWWDRRQPKDPVYQQRPLSAWLVDLQPTRSTNLAQAREYWNRHQAAEQAVQRIGTHALPRLRRMLRHRDSPLASKLSRWVPRATMIRWHWLGATERNVAAARALQVLGRDAAPAVPELTRLLETQRNIEVRRSATLALAKIGPRAEAAVIPLTQAAIVDRDRELRNVARFALQSIGEPSKRGLPIIRQYLASPDWAIQSAAMVTFEAVAHDQAPLR